MCRIFITNLPNLASVYLHGLPQLNTVSVRKVPPQTSFCSYRASYHLLNSGRKADICWALLPMTSSLQICVALQALPTQLHSATFSLWGSVATQSFTVQYTVNSDQELNNFFLIFFIIMLAGSEHLSSLLLQDELEYFICPPKHTI